MSLYWNWEDKMGTCKCEEGPEYNLYKGNAFMIAVYENKENQTYTVSWFASDKQHMRNLLGLTNYDSNFFEKHDITEFTLDTKYKETKQFVTMAIEAKYKVRINLY